MNKVEYWTDFAFKKMRKDKCTMPTTLIQVLALDDFKKSSVSEEELRESIKKRFSLERQKIVDQMKIKLKKLDQEKPEL